MDVDFRSGCSIEELNVLIDQFDELDRHEFDDQMALEVHSMKEHIFHITGKLSQMDPRFPVANEYMLLSGGLKTGAIHIDQTIGGDEQFKNVMEDMDGASISPDGNNNNSEKSTPILLYSILIATNTQHLRHQ